jgi:O-antigen ligase
MTLYPLAVPPKVRSRNEVVEKDDTRLGFDTLILAAVITSLYYVLPLGRYALAGMSTDFRIYDFAFIGFMLVVGLRYLSKLVLLWKNRDGFHFWALVLLLMVWFSLALTVGLGGLNQMLPAVIRAYRFSFYFLLAGFTVIIVDTPKRYRFILWVIFLNISIQAILSFLQQFHWLPNFWPSYWIQAYGVEPVGTLSPHHKQLGAVMLLGIGLSFSLMRIYRNAFLRIIFFLLLTIMGMDVFFVSSGTGMLGILVLLLAYGIVHKRNRIMAVTVLGLSLVLIFFVQPVQNLVLDSLKMELNDKISMELARKNVLDMGNGRFAIYAESIPKLIQKKPWVLLIGSGFQNLTMPGATAAHNNYIEVWLELGIFGFLVYMTFLKSILSSLSKTASQAKRHFERMVARDILAVFIAVLFTMMVGETLWAQNAMFTLTGQIMTLMALATCPLNWSKQSIHQGRDSI